MFELSQFRKRAASRLCYIEAPILKLTDVQPGDSTETEITVYHYVNQMHIFLHPFV